MMTDNKYIYSQLIQAPDLPTLISIATAPAQEPLPTMILICFNVQTRTWLIYDRSSPDHLKAYFDAPHSIAVAVLTEQECRALTQLKDVNKFAASLQHYLAHNTPNPKKLDLSNFMTAQDRSIYRGQT